MRLAITYIFNSDNVANLQHEITSALDFASQSPHPPDGIFEWSKQQLKHCAGIPGTPLHSFSVILLISNQDP